MQLSDYLAREGLSHEAFAKVIRVSQAAVTRYCNGVRFPRPQILARIERATGGRVTANDFMEGHEP